VPHQIIWSWYTGRWRVGCYIWYSEEETGQSPSPPILLLAVPNVTAHPSTASVPITVLLYNGPLLCGFNVPVKGSYEQRFENIRDMIGFGISLITRAKDFWICWRQFVELLEIKLSRVSSAGCFEIKVRTDTAQIMNLRIARLRHSRNVVGESDVLIKDETKVAIGCVQWRVVYEAGWINTEKFGFRRVKNLRVTDWQSRKMFDCVSYMSYAWPVLG